MFLCVPELNGMRVQAAMDQMHTLVQPKARELGSLQTTQKHCF